MKLEFSDRWNFIEKYHPRYHSLDEVLYLDILARYLDPYERCDMDEEDIKMVEDDFGENTEAIEEYMDKSERKLFLEACEYLYDNLEEYDE